VVTPTEFAVDWILKVAGVAAAILFGIWAPVSYNAQSSGNASNDQSQARLISKVDRLADEIETLQGVMEGIGALRAWEHCDNESKSTLPVCEYLTKKVDIDSLLKALAVKTKHKPSSRRTGVPSAPTSTSSTTTSISTPASDSMSSIELVSRTTGTPSQFSSLTRPDLTSMPTAPTTVPEFPVEEPAGGPAAAGSLPRMALSLGFLFGIIVCLGILSGRRVLERNRQRREYVPRKLEEKTML
jgi:hypothetical protein